MSIDAYMRILFTFMHVCWAVRWMSEFYLWTPEEATNGCLPLWAFALSSFSSDNDYHYHYRSTTRLAQFLSISTCPFTACYWDLLNLRT